MNKANGKALWRTVILSYGGFWHHEEATKENE